MKAACNHKTTHPRLILYPAKQSSTIDPFTQTQSFYIPTYAQVTPIGSIPTLTSNTPQTPQHRFRLLEPLHDFHNHHHIGMHLSKLPLEPFPSKRNKPKMQCLVKRKTQNTAHAFSHSYHRMHRRMPLSIQTHRHISHRAALCPSQWSTIGYTSPHISPIGSAGFDDARGELQLRFQKE